MRLAGEVSARDNRFMRHQLTGVVETLRVDYLVTECLFPPRNATERGREEGAIERKRGRERV